MKKRYTDILDIKAEFKELPDQYLEAQWFNTIQSCTYYLTKNNTKTKIKINLGEMQIKPNGKMMEENFKEELSSCLTSQGITDNKEEGNRIFEHIKNYAIDQRKTNLAVAQERNRRNQSLNRERIFYNDKFKENGKRDRRAFKKKPQYIEECRKSLLKADSDKLLKEIEAGIKPFSQYEETQLLTPHITKFFHNLSAKYYCQNSDQKKLTDQKRIQFLKVLLSFIVPNDEELDNKPFFTQLLALRPERLAALAYQTKSNVDLLFELENFLEAKKSLKKMLANHISELDSSDPRHKLFEESGDDIIQKFIEDKQKLIKRKSEIKDNFLTEQINSSLKKILKEFPTNNEKKPEKKAPLVPLWKYFKNLITYNRKFKKSKNERAEKAKAEAAKAAVDAAAKAAVATAAAAATAAAVAEAAVRAAENVAEVTPSEATSYTSESEPESGAPELKAEIAKSFASDVYDNLAAKTETEAEAKAAEIEMSIREKAGLISKKIEGNPIEKEKAESVEEVPTKKN